MRQDLPKNQAKEGILEINGVGMCPVVASGEKGASSIGPSQQSQTVLRLPQQTDNTTFKLLSEMKGLALSLK